MGIVIVYPREFNTHTCIRQDNNRTHTCTLVDALAVYKFLQNPSNKVNSTGLLVSSAVSLAQHSTFRCIHPSAEKNPSHFEFTMAHSIVHVCIQLICCTYVSEVMYVILAGLCRLAAAVWSLAGSHCTVPGQTAWIGLSGLYRVGCRGLSLSICKVE